MNISNGNAVWHLFGMNVDKKVLYGTIIGKNITAWHLTVKTVLNSTHLNRQLVCMCNGRNESGN